MCLPGREGWQAANKTPSEICAWVLPMLREAFEDVPPPLSVVVTRWEEHPHFKGAYSFFALGTSTFDIDVLSKPVKRSLLFAGEAASLEYQGSLHGAYLSGLKAATDVVDMWMT
uniref:Amine oxidase domain-containing protein n=1 Tax=Eutreptiella gymnastica TaxID=73025 RepID=A0A7S1HU23_9EUGL|mmetsp:Transcript_105760/g.182406  ORF Transcript_105760/g.182406 Transcript_105760/m.182406 type:complete len:114 (+) Transcript_105760:46-387(+)